MISSSFSSPLEKWALYIIILFYRWSANSSAQIINNETFTLQLKDYDSNEYEQEREFGARQKSHPWADVCNKTWKFIALLQQRPFVHI